MPLPLLEAHATMLPVIQAEEAITLASAVAAGMGSLSDEGKRAWADLIAPALRAPRPAPRTGTRTGTHEAMAMRLAAMGTRVEIRRRKG